ncbi:cystathionine beta-lyase [Brachybacterium endophyticum]|uniref:Cytochrome bc1 complex cytochrome c subunit n=1 Tax=Brachybacterium endophyticum TaxID=2182385 RepID=A0A2U2RJ17_9MICO|nr:cytochrome c [Brachybacterium endophyticum]PWH05867.1 cystathionine beta-lyase [Brachybacterium endophyticum]
MKALAARRHHPLAFVVILLLALAATGGLYAAFQPRDAQAESYSQDDVDAGKDLFLANCASCHGTNAQGMQDKSGATLGPSLIGVGAAAVDFQVGTGRMPMQNSGAQAWRKAPQMNDEQTRQLAAYVSSLGPGPSVPDEDQLDASKADLENGGNVFRVNCAMCHNAGGAGGALTRGKFAPPLQGVESKHIYEAMETGPQNMPVFNDDNISAKDKRDVVSYLGALEENGSPGGISLGSFGPVTEGLYAWTIVLSLLVGCAVWLGAKAK